MKLYLLVEYKAVLPKSRVISAGEQTVQEHTEKRALRGYQISPPDICSPFPQISDVHAQGHQADEDISSHPKDWQT